MNLGLLQLMCVCKALGIDPTATRRLDEDEKNTLCLTQGTSGNPNVTIINEPGLYTLVLGSRKPEAKTFKRWITHEVIPSIRKTGGYQIPQSKEALYRSAFLAAYQDMKELKNKVQEQKETIAYAQDTIAHKDDVITGLTEDVPVAELRQRISNIIRQPGVNYKERWVLLYDEFSSAYHINLSLQYKRYGEGYKTKIDFIDGYLNMIPQLFAIACNLFENDAKTYLTRIRDSITTNSDAIDVKKQALKQAKARFKKESSNVIDFTSQKENNVEVI